MSSSPGLPSVGGLIQKKASVLRTGSRATPIPQNESSSFTTAANLFRNPSFDASIELDEFRLEEGAAKSTKRKVQKPTGKENITDGKQVTKTSRKATAQKDGALDETIQDQKARKARAKKVEIDENGNPLPKPAPKPRTKKAAPTVDKDGIVKEKAPRKSRAKKVEEDVGEGAAAKEKPARKPRAKKSDGTQTVIQKDLVTKSSVSKVDKTISKTADTTSRHFSTTVIDDPFEDSLDHGLAPALRRRSNWTPPPPTLDSALLDLTTPGEQSDCVTTPGRSKTLELGGNAFSDLLGSFKFNNVQNATIKQLTDGAGTRKRKLIELVKSDGSETTSKVEKALKKKATKKKARTITGLATSAYAPEEEEAEEPAPILQYFAYQSTDRWTSDGFKIPPKPRSKSPVKKPGKGAAAESTLLSPESALKQVKDQDFVFGTSSQLAREHSPGFLRDIHTAMRASNEANDDDPFADTPLGTTSASSINSKELPAPKRKLWSAAARDVSGELMDVEIINMVESPVLPKQNEKLENEEPLPLIEDDIDFWHDIDQSPVQLPSASQPQQRVVGPVEVAIRNLLSSSPSGSPKQSAPSPKTSQKSKQSTTPTKSAKTTPKPSPQRTKALKAGMPDFTAYTTAQLEKRINDYHFKPIKSRDRMITLLETCWKGKQDLALKASEAEATASSSQVKASQPVKVKVVSSSQTQVTSPKRPRGRPRKDSTLISPSKPKYKTSTVEYLELDSDTPLSQIRTPRKSQFKRKEPKEDISDSDTPPRPSPPRRHPSKIRSIPLPLQSSSATDVDVSPNLSPKSSEVRLFKYITRAITKAPRSTDPKDPSWHEKILLYDPIVLEDLTVWLNTGGLEKVGWDDEVEPKEVKKWCESKSICCLWKENLRGGARSRY